MPKKDFRDERNELWRPPVLLFNSTRTNINTLFLEIFFTIICEIYHFFRVIGSGHALYQNTFEESVIYKAKVISCLSKNQGSFFVSDLRLIL
jgi:hypothetical protein